MLFWTSGCASRREPVIDIPWKAADLRALEAPGTQDPSSDLIAAYARLTKTDLELRFDFLGSPEPYGYDLLVLLDTQPGGSSALPWGQLAGLEWDLALRFPAQGVGRAVLASGKAASIRPRIQRFSVQDAAVLRLSRIELAKESKVKPEEFHFQAYLLLPGSDLPADSIGPLAVSGPAPNTQAALLLAFWDTLPAATPTQALRRWNGAHTGPYGQRHGLSILLAAANQSRIPIALLDLRQPEKLAALDSMGGLPTVQQMAREKRLILPETAFGDPRAVAESNRFSTEAGQQYRLPNSSFFYGAIADGSPPGDYQAVFASLSANRYLRKWENRLLIPLPGSENLDETQVNEEGLTITIREALLRSALEPDSDGLIVLGGSLPSSAWGDSLMADPAFTYLAGHPWIHLLNGDELLHFPAREGPPDCPDLLCQVEPVSSNPNEAAVFEALRGTPPGFFTDLAWKNYLNLTEPTADEKLQALRAGYLGQVGPLLAAARWNASPQEWSACTEDLDWDGAPECVLSSKDYFLVMDPQGGRLVLAVARQNNQPYQIIGPRSQFVTGLGDRLEWHPELGLGGDPQEIPGAFSTKPDTFQEYQSEAQPGQITMIRPESGIIKRFQLTGDGFHVEFESGVPTQISLPLLLLDPKTWQPAGYARYHASQSNPQEFTWKLTNSVSVNVTVQEASLSANSFADALPALRKPEDPNADLPAGFFLPFPMAAIELQAQGNFSLDLRIKQSGK